MTAPAIGSAAIVLALVLVWYLGNDAEPPNVSAGRALAVALEPAGGAPAAAVARSDARSVPAAPTNAPLVESVSSTSTSERAPLPGETPATPMTQMLADRQSNVIIGRTDSGDGIPPGLTQGELEFAAEPVDAAWAPGAEADLLAKFAQMPGLKLLDLQVECRSTMCRLQLTQPREPPPEGRAASPGRTPFNLLRRDSIAGVEARWMMVIGDGTGPTRSVAYLWREGFARRDCYEDGRPTTCSAEADEGDN
jgi:hypothetical protein